jgi:hypothetical protein
MRYYNICHERVAVLPGMKLSLRHYAGRNIRHQPGNYILGVMQGLGFRLQEEVLQTTLDVIKSKRD